MKPKCNLYTIILLLPPPQMLSQQSSSPACLASNIYFYSLTHTMVNIQLVYDRLTCTTYQTNYAFLVIISTSQQNKLHLLLHCVEPREITHVIKLQLVYI